MAIGDFPESLSQAMLVGTMLVGRLGVLASRHRLAALRAPRVGATNCTPEIDTSEVVVDFQLHFPT